MQYVLVISEPPSDFALRSDPERAQGYWAAWSAYGQALAEAGVMRGGNGLQVPGTGATLRLRDGKRHVQDGPLPDSKEQLGGYFVIEVPDLETALDWAARCPAAPTGHIEVRPVLETPPR